MKLRHRIKAWFRRLSAPRDSHNTTGGTWRHLPIKLTLDLAMEDDTQRCVKEAALWWNAQFPTRALFSIGYGTSSEPAVVGLPVRGVVGVTEDVPLGPSALASTERFYEDKDRKHLFGAHIRLRPSLRGAQRHRAVMHELGHVLGLDHTEDDTRKLMDIDGTGELLTPSELEHVRRQQREAT